MLVSDISPTTRRRDVPFRPTLCEISYEVFRRVTRERRDFDSVLLSGSVPGVFTET